MQIQTARPFPRHPPRATMGRMDTPSSVLRCAQNNAAWCDALCRAHGVPGEFHEAFWVNRGKPPPFTPKLITLAGPERARAQLAGVRSLVGSQPDFGVKDAFRSLDLAPLGFDVLFQATWIEWTPDTTIGPDGAERLEWSVVRDADELVQWESAWRGSAANASTGDKLPIFPPVLLNDPAIRFLAGRQAGVVVASAALNRTGDVVGLSNVFSNVRGPLFPGCMRRALALFPGCRFVGYERGDGLADAMKAGFQAIHGLTVWRRAPS